MATRMSAEPKGQKRGVRIALATLAVLLTAPPWPRPRASAARPPRAGWPRWSSATTASSTRIRISYSARCTDPRYRFPNVLRVEPPFDDVDDRRGHARS